MSCVRCDGDGRWAWIPGRGLRCAPFPPPTSDQLAGGWAWEMEHPQIPIRPSSAWYGGWGWGFFWIVDLQFGLTWIVAYFIPYFMTYIYIPYCIPLCLNRKFQNPFNAQLGTYQPPIPNSSQASALSYKYIGRLMRKIEGSPIGLGKNFGRLNGWNTPLAKVVDFVPLGAISGPGSPDPDLARFHMNVTTMEHQWYTPNSLKFLWFYWHFEIPNEP